MATGLRRGLDANPFPAEELNIGNINQFSFILSYSLIQFTSQVLPPSTEKACSDRAESDEVGPILNLTSMDRESYGS